MRGAEKLGKKMTASKTHIVRSKTERDSALHLSSNRSEVSLSRLDDLKAMKKWME